MVYYTRVATRSGVVDRGKERHVKFMGLQKWGLHLVMETLPVMLQSALLLLGIALAVYLWDLDVSAAEVVLVITSFGLAFYACITVVATIWSDCPFQTPVSILLQVVRPWAEEFAIFTRVRLTNSLGRVFKIFASGTTSPKPADRDVVTSNYPKTLSNPAFWRLDPLFTSPIPEDIAASSGFWLLENSTDFSAAAAVAAVFSEFQWPSHHPSSTALVRLRDIYVEYLGAPKPDKSTRLKALQSATAYYVLYHTQLIWSTWKGLEVEVEKLPPDFPPDLFLHQPTGEWDGDDVFEYLLHIDVKDHTEPIKVARFLSYIAPYWFCGDSNSAIRFRPSRLPTLDVLIEVLEKYQAWALESRPSGSWALAPEFQVYTPATVTNCILCAGAAMDFPLHPEDLIRVDKRWCHSPRPLTVELTGNSAYLVLTFKSVVEHIHRVVVEKGSRHRFAETTLGIIYTLVKKLSFPLVDAVWINNLLESAAWGKVDDKTFTLLLRFSGLREVDDIVANFGIISAQYNDRIQQDETDPQPPGGMVRVENPTPESALFDLILRNVKARSAQEDGWQDDAVYGGLIAIRDILGLRTFLPEAEFLEMLSKAMEGKTEGENKKGDKPLRVKKAAYGIVLAARDSWLRLAELRPVLEELDIPRKLHSVVIEAGRPDYWRSFLKMMEILSEDGFWHPYLRKAMDIWVPLHHEEPAYVLRILTRVGELLLPKRGDYDVDNPLEKVLQEEWETVPGRLPTELTVNMLEPLAEVTEGITELFTESDRRAILAEVEQVIPRLGQRRDGNYSDPGNDIRHIIDNLLRVLQQSIQSSSRRPAYR